MELKIPRPALKLYAASFPKALKPQYRFTQINDFFMEVIVLFSWEKVLL
jgi:hypothetical protein